LFKRKIHKWYSTFGLIMQIFSQSIFLLKWDIFYGVLLVSGFSLLSYIFFALCINTFSQTSINATYAINLLSQFVLLKQSLLFRHNCNFWANFFSLFILFFFHNDQQHAERITDHPCLPHHPTQMYLNLILKYESPKSYIT
jgi:hypothetical protein